MEIQSIILLIGFVSICSPKPNEFVMFACRFFDGMFDCPKVVGCRSGETIANSDNVTQSGTFGEEFSFVCLNGYTGIGSNGIMTCGEDGDWTMKVSCKDIDDCVDEPCGDYGHCTDKVNGYECRCSPGFTGINCEIDIDDCVDHPVYRQCTDQVNGYECRCSPGFNGTNCETDIDDCASKPCENNGICQDDVNSFNCLCNGTGFTGKLCDCNIDDCVDHPCGDYGQCTDKVNEYECRCSPGFTGTNCETDIDDCVNKPCGELGQCQDVIKGYYCKCNLGFTGERCEEDIDDCASNPCGDNGQCMDEVSGFNCTCNAGYKGRNCDQTVQCLDEPEINNGALDTKIRSRNFEDKYEYSCNPPFIQNGNKGTVTCTETGEWVANITCEVQCLDEPEIPNGTLDTNITSRNFGDQYGFSCDPYFIKGETKDAVTCTESGEWETNITCEDCFIRELGVYSTYVGYLVNSEDECQLKCDETCTVAEYSTSYSDGYNCLTYGLPVLFRSDQMSLPECIQKCNNLPKCLTMNYYEENTCNLYSFTVDELNDTEDYNIRDFEDTTDIIAEKNTTCPSIL